MFEDDELLGDFAQLAAGYRTRHKISKEDLKRAIGHVSWKSHQNGVHSPKAHLRKAVSMETILKAPMIAEPLGLFDPGHGHVRVGTGVDRVRQVR